MRSTALCVVLLAICASAAALQPAVQYKPDSRKLPPRHLPFAGTGTCGEHVYDSEAGTTTVSCLGPKHLLSPGQTIDTMMVLESPYPKDEVVLVTRQTSEMVDDNMRPVPLSEVYVHHYGAGFGFVQGSGAEYRTSFIRKQLPAPYGLVVNGTKYISPMSRMTNIQLINTIDVPLEHKKSCLECWCDHDPWHTKGTISDAQLADRAHPHTDKGDPTSNTTRPAELSGSLLCCHQCLSDNPNQGPFGYHLQYNITYRSIKSDEHIKAVGPMIFDAVGGSFEYQLPKPTGPGTTHTLTFDTVVDKTCPQDRTFEILRCTGHQHFGGQCLSMYNLDKDELICRTCPEFGTQAGVPGDEEGYVSRIPDDDLSTPYKMEPGTRIRIESKYDYSVPRFGVMGLLFVTAADLTRPCTMFGGNSSNSNSNNAIAPYGVMPMGMHHDDGVVNAF